MPTNPETATAAEWAVFARRILVLCGLVPLEDMAPDEVAFQVADAAFWASELPADAG